MRVNRTDPRWKRIHASLNRRARVPSKKELALGLGLAMAPAPMGHATSPAVVQQPVGWKHYEDVAKESASKYGIPPDMFLRLLKTENPQGDPLAVNPKSGATGLGQFMPGTAESMDVDPSSAIASIDASARYLKELHDEFGDWEPAVMAYNWGPGNVRHWLEEGGQGPLPSETSAYVAAIEP